MASKTLNLVLDFDGTITTKDTIGALAEIGLNFQKRRGFDLSAAWKQILEEYSRDHVEYVAAYKPPAGSRLNLHDELAYLRSLKEVELHSVRRVEDSGIFRGISREYLVEAGNAAREEGRVKLRDGFADLMNKAKHNGWPVSVVSVNWSRSFIQGVLSAYSFDVVANDVEMDGSISGPSVLGLPSRDTILMTCEDKLRALRALTDRQGANSTVGMVYFGDSTSDLECLLEARGVVVSSSTESPLLKTLSRVNCEVPRALHYRDLGNMVWASTFDEVLQSGFL